MKEHRDQRGLVVGEGGLPPLRCLLEQRLCRERGKPLFRPRALVSVVRNYQESERLKRTARRKNAAL